MTKKRPYKPAIRDIDVEEFVRRLQTDTDPEKRFALFIGAGCSVSSGIPSAGELVKDRWISHLGDLRAPSRSDLDDWAREVIKGYDPENPAASYGELINLLFLTQEDRRREIEDICGGKKPLFAYLVLAQLVAFPGGRFNIVLTTNFDDLVEEALYLSTKTRALVISHESLASFIRPTPTGPVVIKLHGDHRLSPRNTAAETETLEEEIQRSIAMVLHDRGIIFMGYRGADHGILKMLNSLPSQALPFGAYWVHPNEPHGPIREWLSRRQGVWVRSGRFDEVMFLLWKAFELPQHIIDLKYFNQIIHAVHQNFEKLSRLTAISPPLTISPLITPNLTISPGNIIPRTGSFTLSAEFTNEKDFGKRLNDLTVGGNPVFEYYVAYFIESIKPGSKSFQSPLAISCILGNYTYGAPQTSLTVSAMSLTPGIYRPTCVVKMSPRGEGSGESPFHVVGFVEGPMIEIYQP